MQVDATPSFRNMEMRSPRFNTVPVPSFIKEVGPQCDQKLMTPAQRREVLDFEIRTRAAHEYMRKAATDRTKTRKQIGGISFHRGVLGYDSTNNEESEVYGARARELHRVMEKMDSFHEKRAEYMRRAHGNSMYNTLHPNQGSGQEGAGGERVLDKTFQSKHRQETFDLSFQGTYNSLFGSQEQGVQPLRTQHLRDQDLSGKNYNMIQHTRIEHWPSNPVQRLENRGLAHPSQTSLEGPRNLQGAIPPR